MIVLPDLRQQDDHSCGAVAIETVLQYDGIPAGRWIKRLASPLNGIEPEVVSAVMFAAYSGSIVRGAMDVPLLKHLTKQKRPVICLVTLDAGGHYVVVRGVKNNKVFCQCPTNGPVSFSLKKWTEAWVVDQHGPNAVWRFGVAGLV